MNQYSDILKDLILAFATELCKHKLSPHMTPDQIITLVSGQPASTKSTPQKEQKEVDAYDGEIDMEESPGGIAEKRARQLLGLAHAGVPEDMKIHTKNICLFKPNKQHKEFYTKSCFSGPKADEAVIDWLAELAGDVSPPPEPEVFASLPAKWAGEKKKAVNLLSLVHKHKKEDGDEYKFINWESSKGRAQNDETLLYDDEFEICGTKKNKAEFLNLIAWLKEHPGVKAEAEGTAVKAAKPKGTKGKGKGGKKAKKDESESVESETKVSEESEPNEAASTKAKPKGKGKAKAAKEEKSELATVVANRLLGRAAKESDKDDKSNGSEDQVKDDDDGTSSDDGDDKDADTDDKLFVKGYDQKKLEKLREKIEGVKEGEFLHLVTMTKMKKTEKSEKTFTFNDTFQLAIPNEFVEDQVVKMMEEC